MTLLGETAHPRLRSRAAKVPRRHRVVAVAVVVRVVFGLCVFLCVCCSAAFVLRQGLFRPDVAVGVARCRVLDRRLLQRSHLVFICCRHADMCRFLCVGVGQCVVDFTAECEEDDVEMLQAYSDSLVQSLTAILVRSATSLRTPWRLPGSDIAHTVLYQVSGHVSQQKAGVHSAIYCHICLLCSRQPCLYACIFQCLSASSGSVCAGANAGSLLPPAITAVSSLAASLDEAFLKYYTHLMPGLVGILQTAASSGGRVGRSQPQLPPRILDVCCAYPAGRASY